MTRSDDASRIGGRLAALKAEHGDTVSLDEVAGVVEGLMSSLEGDLSAVDLAMHRELQALMDYIGKARREIAAINAVEIPEHHIPIATDELDAVVQATEEATGTILDAAEQVYTIAGELDGSAAERLRAIATSIYEASNFQDITGQRITKVVKTLRHIEVKIVALVRAFGQDAGASGARGVPSAEASADDQELLNGPQLPAKANSQDDIDALLASFD